MGFGLGLVRRDRSHAQRWPRQQGRGRATLEAVQQFRPAVAQAGHHGRELAIATQRPGHGFFRGRVRQPVTARILSAGRWRIATGRLTRRVGREILRWAQGRSCSQRSSLGGGLRTRRRGVFIGTVASAWQGQASGARRRRPLAAMRDGEPTAIGGWSSTRVAVIDMRAAGRPLAAILAYMVAAADKCGLWTTCCALGKRVSLSSRNAFTIIVLVANAAYRALKTWSLRLLTTSSPRSAW